MNEKGNEGIGFIGFLTLIFITLKLTGQIDWSWWWVWSPFWLPIVIMFGLGTFLMVGSLAFAVIDDMIRTATWFKNRRKK